VDAGETALTMSKVRHRNEITFFNVVVSFQDPA
jgi:hypothetical protein